jgi:chemotaxis protein methyltransferase CheR
MLTIENTALERLASLLHERAGLKIPSESYHGLKLALKARMPVLGMTDALEYVTRLRSAQGEKELRALLPLVTVGKTDFFRDPKQFQALEKRVLPELLMRARMQSRKVTIWSAGCATGEEPYSLAMLLSEIGAKFSEVDLLATDLNPAAVEHAKAGIFPGRRMGGVSETRRDRHFKHLGEDRYEAKPRVRDYIRFDQHNLAAPKFEKILPGSLDLVLCRNVIIYFDLPTIQALMDRFWSSVLVVAQTGWSTLLGVFGEFVSGVRPVRDD